MLPAPQWRPMVCCRHLDDPHRPKRGAFPCCVSLVAMAGAGLRLLCLAATVALSGVRAETCTDPVISPSYYTTSDAVISSETVFVVEISLTCKNGAQVSVGILGLFHF